MSLGQHKSDNNIIKIFKQLSEVFCLLFRYVMGLVASDYNKQLII